MGLGLGDILLVLFFLLYLYWLVTPRLEDPELLAECLEEARLAQEVSQRYADDPEMNGYLSPTFYPFWGQFPILPEREETPLETKVREWAKYSSNWSGDEEWDLESLQDDPEYLELKEWFKGLAEELRGELEKPCFVVPACSDRRATSASINAMYLGSGLRALAESYLETGQSREAVNAITLSLRLTIRLQDSQVNPMESLHDGFLGWVLRDFRVLVGNDLSHCLDWANVARICLPVPSPIDYMSLRLRRRLAFHWKDFPMDFPYSKEEPLRGLERARVLLGTVLARALGITGRDSRYLCNGYTKLIRNWENGRVEDLPEARWSVIGDWLVPRGQYLENIFSLGLRTSSSRLGLGVSSALMAHRLNHGEFPADLRALPHDLDPDLFE